jgi:hypothetical protein
VNGGLKEKIWRLLAPILIATATVTAETTTSTRRAIFTGTRFINCQRAALKVFLVKHGNGLGRIFLRAHFDKGKAARTPGSPVLHDVNCHDPAGLREMVMQIVFGCCEGQVSYE